MTTISEVSTVQEIASEQFDESIALSEEELQLIAGGECVVNNI